MRQYIICCEVFIIALLLGTAMHFQYNEPIIIVPAAALAIMALIKTLVWVLDAD